MKKVENNQGLDEQETRHLDITLRPETFSQYVGQETIKNNLHILLTAS